MKIKIFLLIFLKSFISFNLIFSMHFDKAKGPVFTGTEEEVRKFVDNIENIDAMQKFIAEGGNPNIIFPLTSSTFSLTLLMALLASNKPNQLELIEHLLKNGADVNFQIPASGFYVLHFLAVLAGDDIIKLGKFKSLIEFFKKYNINFNLKDKSGNTPLMILLDQFPIDKIKLVDEIAIELILNGADYHIKNNWGESAYDLAFKNYNHAKITPHSKEIKKNFVSIIHWKLMNLMHYNDSLNQVISENLKDVLIPQLQSIIIDYSKSSYCQEHNFYSEKDLKEADESCCSVM